MERESLESMVVMVSNLQKMQEHLQIVIGYAIDKLNESPRILINPVDIGHPEIEEMCKKENLGAIAVDEVDAGVMQVYLEKSKKLVKLSERAALEVQDEVLEERQE